MPIVAAYQPIAKDDSTSPAASDEELTTTKDEPRLHPLVICTLVACLSLCVANLTLLIRTAIGSAEQVVDLDTLRRPSTFIDLDTLEWDASRLAALPPIVNVPLVMAPVSRTDVQKVWPVDPRAWMTHEGTVSPEQHEVLITQDVSMIFQFRVLDHKMERCALVAEIPSEEEIRARKKDNNIELDGDTTVRVYELDARGRTLKRHNLSHATKPPRTRHIGDFKVSIGAMNGTMEFDCEERSLRTFEVTCPGSRCHINFWQDRDKPVMGISVSMIVETS